MAGVECWRGGDELDGYEDGGVDDELGSGLLSSPPQRAKHPMTRSRRWAEEVSAAFTNIFLEVNPFHFESREGGVDSGTDHLRQT